MLIAVIESPADVAANIQLSARFIGSFAFDGAGSIHSTGLVLDNDAPAQCGRPSKDSFQICPANGDEEDVCCGISSAALAVIAKPYS